MFVFFKITKMAGSKIELSPLIKEALVAYGLDEENFIKDVVQGGNNNLFKEKVVKDYEKEILQSLKNNKIDQEKVKHIFLQQNGSEYAVRMIAVLEDGTDVTRIISSAH
jgi:hypothetical protein